MSTNRLIADLEEQLAIVRRRIEKLKHSERSLIDKLQFARTHSRLALRLGSLGCKKMETAWRRFRILEYISTYNAGLSAGELQEQMHKHGIVYNYSTIRVEMIRLRENGMLKKALRTKKWILTSEGQSVLNGILNYDGEGAK